MEIKSMTPAAGWSRDRYWPRASLGKKAGARARHVTTQEVRYGTASVQGRLTNAFARRTKGGWVSRAENPNRAGASQKGG